MRWSPTTRRRSTSMQAERSLRSEDGCDEGPDAVLWDMDGTLVDSEKLWSISLHDTARWLGGTLSLAAREAVVGGDMARTLATLFDDLGLARDPARMADAERYI